MKTAEETIFKMYDDILKSDKTSKESKLEALQYIIEHTDPVLLPDKPRDQV
jgi:hypothetical protein